MTQQDLTKGMSVHLEWVDFSGGQVAFNSYLPEGQAPSQFICQLNKKNVNQELSRACKI